MGHLRLIFVVMILGYVVYDFTNDADRDESGSIVGEGQIDVFAMRAGDCFNDPQELIDSETGVVYAVFDVSFNTFPGDGPMFDVATDECLKRFEDFVRRSYDESILDIFPIYPNDDSWSRLNDREVVCAVYHIDGEKLTGSNKGSGV